MTSRKTTHQIINTSATDLKTLADKSVALVVTSPPYPMIEMWNQSFAEQNPHIKELLEQEQFDLAFEKMHQILDLVWQEVHRVLIEGGIACINIGDATKNCAGDFKLFSNHSRIISSFLKLGFSVLPDIIWRKQTNAPNKFMGSGMYPAGAYVTYEHEYILIFRKGAKRVFAAEREKENRRQSAYFWEERNVWFSDIWELKGTKQTLKVTNTRERSGAFPFEIASRLINMYSVKGDLVLDPFVGTGTTMLAAMVAGRNSVGVEIESELCESILPNLDELLKQGNIYTQNRIEHHLSFIQEQLAQNKELYQNKKHNFPVKTRQEIDLELAFLEQIKKEAAVFSCSYFDAASSG